MGADKPAAEWILLYVTLWVQDLNTLFPKTAGLHQFY